MVLIILRRNLSKLLYIVSISSAGMVSHSFPILEFAFCIISPMATFYFSAMLCWIVLCLASYTLYTNHAISEPIIAPAITSPRIVNAYISLSAIK